MDKSAQSTAKRRKSLKVCRRQDRISTLPDSVLYNILSYLPTKSAVATSILSSRWRLLWTCVPVLDFHDGHISWDEDQTRCKATAFVDFVSRVFILNKVQALKKFCLTCDESWLELFHVSTWLSSAIDRNVEQLELSLNKDIKDSILLPQKLFVDCKQLVVLKLNRGVLLNVPSSVDFRSLTVLHLISVYHSHEDNLNLLLSGCPLLEDLCVNNLLTTSEELSLPASVSRICVSISILPKLKRLELTSLVFWSLDNKIEINAPLLEYLRLQHNYDIEYSLGNFPELNDAYLDLCLGDIPLLLKAVQQVNFLQLQAVQCLRKCTVEHLPLFSNLVRLELFGICGSCLLFGFLEKSHKLQILTVEEMIPRCQLGWRKPPQIRRLLWEKPKDVPIDWGEPKHVPACLSSTIKSVTLEKFSGSEHEMEVVKYILQKATALERMSLGTTGDMGLDEKFKILKILSKPSRASTACKLFFD